MSRSMDGVKQSFVRSLINTDPIIVVAESDFLYFYLVSFSAKDRAATIGKHSVFYSKML